jgi:hypothetical protein
VHEANALIQEIGGLERSFFPRKLARLPAP